MVTMPIRGSLSSRISSATSRWIWSATRKPRLGIDRLCRMDGFSGGPQRTDPAVFWRAGSGDEAVSALQGSSHFLHLEELELVVLLDVVVVLQLDAALE